MTDRAARLVRDGATYLWYAQLSVFAFFLYAFDPSVTLLRDDEHLSDTIAGLHGTAYAVGVIASTFLAPPVLARTGRTRGLWLSLAALGAGVLIYISVPVLAVTLAGALICGIAGSFVALTSGAALADHHGPAGAAALAEANGMSAAIGVLAPLLVGAFVAVGLGWRAALVLMPVFGVALFLLDRLLGPIAADRPVAAAAGTRARPGPLGGEYRLSAAFVVACVGIEFSTTLWCAQLLREDAHLSKAVAATGVTAVVGGMSIGRFITTAVAARRPVDWILARGLVLNAAGFAIFWFARTGWLAFTGLALAGLGMATQYPLGVARAIRAAGTPSGAARAIRAAGTPSGAARAIRAAGDPPDAARSDRAAAIMAGGTGAAIGLAPFALGSLADQVGIRYAFLLVPALIVTAAGTLVTAHRRNRAPAPPPAHPIAVDQPVS